MKIETFNNKYVKFPTGIILLLCMMVSSSRMSGQHFQFSQFYAAPMYLNPALTGANVCSRLSLNYRNQWTGISGGFQTYQASFDHTLSKLKSGIGFQLFNDNTGVGGIKTTAINFAYAYETQINKKIAGRGGLSFGAVQRSIDLNNYLFADQIARGGTQNSVENLTTAKANYLDVGMGVLIYSQNAWYGFTAKHINQPNQSLLGGVSQLPAELMTHGGFKKIVKKGDTENKKELDVTSITVAYNLKRQKKFTQADLGFYLTKDYYTFGFWYRGIPIYKPVKNYKNNDAMVFLFSVSLDRYKIGYSYDYTMSNLSNRLTNGSHELSMAYQFCNLKKAKKTKYPLISCPKF